MKRIKIEGAMVFVWISVVLIIILSFLRLFVFKA